MIFANIVILQIQVECLMTCDVGCGVIKMYNLIEVQIQYDYYGRR